MPSSAATRPTSSTVANISFCMAMAASRPWLLASFASGVAKYGDTQPPLRPEAPKPAISFSTTTMRR